MMKRMTLAGTLFLCGATLYAGTLSFKGECEKPKAVFEPGEKMVFKIQLLEDAKPVAGKKLKWTRTGDDQKAETGEALSSDQGPLVLTNSIGQPGFVRIFVNALDEAGKPLKDAQGREVTFDGGAGAGLDRLAGIPEPKDFDAFWARQKARLAAVPLKATLTNVPSKNPAILVFDVKVDCAGGKPVSGYLARPTNAVPKSLPAQVNFMGYGVSSANPDLQPGKITFSINAHGIENGRDAGFYKELKEGVLKGYAFDAKENADPETAYFNGMMLRVMRALEFIKSQPEWNGKELIVSGGSQGGLQALNAAALDTNVTRCLAFKPWCCDLGGITLGRLRGWRPDYTNALAYYDPVNQARRITCETVLNTGLGDYICPPSSVTVLYNALKAPRKIEYIQGATHGLDPPGAQRFTVEDITPRSQGR
jgi:cephalosporin-C deacetylase